MFDVKLVLDGGETVSPPGGWFSFGHRLFGKGCSGRNHPRGQDFLLRGHHGCRGNDDRRHPFWGTGRLPRDFVAASKALGANNMRIIWREILPNALPPMIVNASLAVGIAILFEAGLSFLGLGDPNVMSWGYMIGSSRIYIRQAWWTVTFPGLAIFITVLSLSLVGDWLNDFLNPKIKGRRQG